MPLTPAGLGVVEAGVVGVLTVVYGVPLTEAIAIALVDRVISVFSIIVLRLDRLRRLAEAARRWVRASSEPASADEPERPSREPPSQRAAQRPASVARGA